MSTYWERRRDGMGLAPEPQDAADAAALAAAWAAQAAALAAEQASLATRVHVPVGSDEELADYIEAVDQDTSGGPTVGAWVPMDLNVNGWQPISSPPNFVGPSYYSDGTRVYFTGHITNPDNGNAGQFYSMPVGLRPVSKVYVLCPQGGLSLHQVTCVSADSYGALRVEATPYQQIPIDALSYRIA